MIYFKEVINGVQRNSGTKEVEDFVKYLKRKWFPDLLKLIEQGQVDDYMIYIKPNEDSEPRFTEDSIKQLMR